MNLRAYVNQFTNSNFKVLLLIVALILGIKSLLLDYDYLDVYFTLLLQDLFEDRTRWAEHLTQMAKWPYVLLPTFIALVLTQLKFGVRSLPVIPMSLALCMSLDVLLKLFVYVDKPDSELVYVSHLSRASGWPSTFGVVFGSLFGLCLLPLTRSSARGHKEGRGLLGNGPSLIAHLKNLLIQVLAAAVLIAGVMARIVLGGHWPTQVVSSVLFGILASIYLKESWDLWLQDLKKST